MARRKPTVAETVMKLPTALNKTIMDELTPDQRQALTVDQAGRIAQLSGVMARAVGYVIEQPGGKFVMSVREEHADQPEATDGR